jgi:cholesterol transport system auxiliary component
VSRPLSLAGLAILAAGCAIVRPPVRPAIAYYDFGPAPDEEGAGDPRIPASLAVPEIQAPTWLDGRAMHYRLAYDEPARLRSYANSRWAASPVGLLGDVVRGRLARATTEGADVGRRRGSAQYLLRLEVEELGQVFESPSSSRAVVRLRAILLKRADRSVAGHHVFAASQPAPTADASGGVQALAAASRRIAGELVAWVAGRVESPEPQPSPEPTAGPTAEIGLVPQATGADPVTRG